MENDDLRYLAEDIASDILTVAYTSDDDVECTRAQMMLVQSDGTESDVEAVQLSPEKSATARE